MHLCSCASTPASVHPCINMCTTCLAQCSQVVAEQNLTCMRTALSKTDSSTSDPLSCFPSILPLTLTLMLRVMLGPLSSNLTHMYLSLSANAKMPHLVFLLCLNCHWLCLQLCQVVAKQMAHMLTVPERRLVPMSSTATSQIGRAGLVEELKRIPGAPDPVLLETLPMGVAFHHAGVPFAVYPFVFPLPDFDSRSSFRCVFCLLVSLCS